MKIQHLLFAGFGTVILLIALIGGIAVLYSSNISQSLGTSNAVPILLYISEAIILTLGLIVGYFTSRTILDPLKKLQKGTILVGQGNLNYRLKMLGNSEINELSRAFDNMTLNLRKTTISNDILDKKVKERTSQLVYKIEELKKAYADLKELDKAKNEFLNMITHELKTPLTPLMTNLDLLAAGNFGRVTKSQKNSLDVMVRNVDRLNVIIKNILDTTRIDSGKIKLTLDKIQINDVVGEVFTDTKLAANERGLKINSTFGKIPLVRADKELVNDCISNLVNNALKFTNVGSISLKTEKEKNFVKISVTDTGIGIHKKNMTRIFQKFYQESNTLVGKAKGMGLGLYFVKKLMELHGGSIGVESELKKGSTFWLKLPIKSTVYSKPSSRALISRKGKKY